MKRHLIALVAVALIASGCSGDETDTPATTKNGAPDVPLVDMHKVPYNKVPAGGTMTWAISQFPPQWNLNQVDGPQGSTAEITAAILPTTTKIAADGTAVPDHDFITGWKSTTTTPQVVTMNINPKAVWSDGTPITWKDFRAQWKALRNADGPFQIASSTGYDRIRSVARGTSDQQVIVTFAKPFADWKSLFGPLYPASTNSSPEIFNTGWENKIGGPTAGPFVVDDIDQTQQTVTLVHNPTWWGRTPKLDRIVFKTLAPDATPDAFVNGEIDTFDVGPDPDGYAKATGAQDAVVYTSAAPDFRHVTFNGDSPILKDVRVRQAIALAIDRRAIATADLKGLDWPPLPLDNHFFMLGQKGYQDVAGDLGEPNIDEANQLLDQAGWSPGDGGVRSKDGKSLTVRAVIPSGVTVSDQEAKLIQSMVRPIGVKVDIDTVDLNQFFKSYINVGDFDITMFSWLGTPFPISSSKSIYVSPKGGDIQQNYARIGVPAADRLMDKATGELDPQKAIAEINAADKVIFDNVQVFPLYQRPKITAVNKDIVNLGSTAFLSTDYTAIGIMKD